MAVSVNILVSLQVPATLKERIETYCVRHNISFSEFVRSACIEKLDGNTIIMRGKVAEMPEVRKLLRGIEVALKGRARTEPFTRTVDFSTRKKTTKA